MPIYEFRCNACGARVDLFFRSINSEARGTCERCGSADLQRLISKVAILRPPVDPSKFNKQEMLDGVNFENPASMANFFRRMGDTFQDGPNEHMDEIIGRLDHGENVADTLGIDLNHDHGGESSSDGGDSE